MLFRSVTASAVIAAEWAQSDRRVAVAEKRFKEKFIKKFKNKTGKLPKVTKPLCCLSIPTALLRINK